MNNTTLTCEIPVRVSGHWLILMTVVAGVVSAISVVGNSIIIFAYITTKKLHKTNNLLLTNLSLSDLLYGLVGFPFYVVIDFHNEMFCNKSFYLVRKITIQFVVSMQVINIFCIAVERFIGIHFPFFYRAHVTKFRATFAVCVTWILGLGNAILYTVLLHKYSRHFALSVQLSLGIFLIVATFLIYCGVYYVSRRHLRNDHRFGIRTQESRSQVAVFIAVFNAVSWMPPVLVAILDVMGMEPRHWRMIFLLCPLVGTCFNLVIYTYRMKDYRYAVKKMLKLNI